MQRRKSQKKRNKRSLAVSLSPSVHPPSIQAGFIIRKTLRYIFLAASTIPNPNTVTSTTLLSSLCMATSAIAATPLTSTGRIRKVSLWGPPPAALTPVTVTIEFSTTSGATGSPDLRYTDTAMGATNPAYLSKKTPKGAQASFWQYPTSNNTLLQVSGPIGTIMDVDVDLVLNDNSSAVAPVVVAGATLGVIYQQFLDGTAGANLKAVGFQSL